MYQKKRIFGRQSNPELCKYETEMLTVRRGCVGLSKQIKGVSHYEIPCRYLTPWRIILEKSVAPQELRIPTILWNSQIQYLVQKSQTSPISWRSILLSRVGSEVLTAVVMKSSSFCCVTPWLWVLSAFSETSVGFKRTTRNYIPERRPLVSRCFYLYIIVSSV
jgi:hypothetical protein